MKAKCPYVLLLVWPKNVFDLSAKHLRIHLFGIIVYYYPDTNDMLKLLTTVLYM